MMFLRTALVAGLATLCQAFLLPPSVSPVNTDIVNTLPFELKSAVESRTLELECKHCPVPKNQHNELKWVNDLESKLKLQFEIVENGDDTLLLNGVQIYPPHGLPLEPIGAPQLTEELATNDHTAFFNLGYELNVTPVMKSEDDQLELIHVRFQVVEVAGMFVDGLDSVLLKLVKTPSRKLMIGDLGTGPTTNPGGKDCQTLMCQLRKIVAAKLSHLKPKKGCGSKAGFAKAPPHSYGGYGFEQGAHRHHRHQGLSRFLHALKRVAFHILIPVLIGIAAGFTASLLGMLVGHTAIFLWRTFYHRGRKGPYSRVQRNEIGADKRYYEKPLLEHQDPPPVYEDAAEVMSAEKGQL